MDTPERRPVDGGGVSDDYRSDGINGSVRQQIGLSDERDAQLRLRLAAWREGYQLGREHGIAEGRQLEAAERDAAWHAIAAPIARGVPLTELERRRWGPGGREHFGDPRPGDYPGRGAA